MKFIVIFLMFFLTCSAINAEEITYEQAIEKSNENILLIFSTSWCGACKSLKKDLKDINLKHYTVCIIDAEKRKELSNIYKVSAYPTSIIIRNKNVISQKVGYKKSDYSQWLETNRKVPEIKKPNCKCGPDCKRKPDCGPECSCNLDRKVCSCGCIVKCKCWFFCSCGCFWSWLIGN